MATFYASPRSCISLSRECWRLHFKFHNLTSSIPATRQPYSKVRLTAAPPRCPGNEASGKLSEKRVSRKCQLNRNQLQPSSGLLWFLRTYAAMWDLWQTSGLQPDTFPDLYVPSFQHANYGKTRLPREYRNHSSSSASAKARGRVHLFLESVKTEARLPLFCHSGSDRSEFIRYPWYRPDVRTR